MVMHNKENPLKTPSCNRQNLIGLNIENAETCTSSDLYKLLGALNSTKPANKDYFDGNGGNNLVFGGGVPPAPGGGFPGETGWGNTINHEVPEAHQGLGTGPIVGVRG